MRVQTKVLSVYTCISPQRLKKILTFIPYAGNTPNMHRPRRRNVTTFIIGLKKTVTYEKNITHNVAHQRYRCDRRKEKKNKKKVVALMLSSLMFTCYC